MARYNVYGLGNALLDVECEVTPTVLQDLGIEKGVMTLLDEESQNKILSHLDGRPSKRTCGGSAANTIIAISQFGGQTFYSCKVAKDEPGQFYLDDLLECGVDTNLKIHPPEEGITGKCLVFVTPDADRTMNTFLGISSSFSEVELVPERSQILPTPTLRDISSRASRASRRPLKPEKLPRQRVKRLR